MCKYIYSVFRIACHVDTVWRDKMEVWGCENGDTEAKKMGMKDMKGV